jgi:hypothetical protein
MTHLSRVLPSKRLPLYLLKSDLPIKSDAFPLLTSSNHNYSRYPSFQRTRKLGVHVESSKPSVAISYSIAVMSSSVPKAPTIMRSESHPNQDEANGQIDHWLASGLQSYVEEGQRMRDVSNGISPAKRPIVRCSTTHTASRHEKR